MSAMIRSSPPQSGQRVVSISNTRFMRCAQVSGAVGGSVESVRGSAGCGCRGACAVAECLGFRRFAGQIPDRHAVLMLVEHADDLLLRVAFALHIRTTLWSIYKETSDSQWRPFRGEGG
jgi:hypothetical protein